MSVDDQRFSHDIYFLEQNIFHSNYFIIQDENANNVLFAAIPVVALIWRANVYESVKKNKKYFTIVQDGLIPLFERFVVRNESAIIGRIKKKPPIFMSKWQLTNKEEITIGTAAAQESIYMSFNIKINNQKIGEFVRRIAPGHTKIRYILDLSGDPEKKIDRRIGIALAIILTRFSLF